MSIATTTETQPPALEVAGRHDRGSARASLFRPRRLGEMLAVPGDRLLEEQCG
jgi:hypothetical protein